MTWGDFQERTIDALATELGIVPARGRKLVRGFIEAIAKAEKINVPRLGTFYRCARRPQPLPTGKFSQATWSLRFRAGSYARGKYL